MLSYLRLLFACRDRTLLTLLARYKYAAEMHLPMREGMNALPNDPIPETELKL